VFDYDKGLGPGKWLKWFTACMVIYALMTFFPDNKVAVGVGAVALVIGIGLARREIRKGRE